MSAADEADVSLSEGEVSESDDDKASKTGVSAPKRGPASEEKGIPHGRAGPRESLGDVVMTECYDEGELDYDELMEYDKPQVWYVTCISIITPGCVRSCVRSFVCVCVCVCVRVKNIYA